MSRYRVSAGLAMAVVVLAASCGGAGETTSERVIASPGASPPTSEETAPPATSTPAAEAPPDEAPPGEAPAPPADLAAAAVTLNQVASLSQPLDLATRSGDDTLYVAEKGGRIRPVRGETVGQTVLDISGEVSGGGEQGLLGLDFSPDGGRLYVNFTNRGGDTVVREYGFQDGRAVTASARTVLEIAQPFGNHNGGGMVFGPDGYLYISVGDGGSGGDPQGHGQNIGTLLGTMLRIDPLGGNPYAIPDGNPFAGRDGRDEIWAYGLRNPWRFSFDRATGDLWIADVGQNSREEVNFAPVGAGGGQNYGWARMEGTSSFSGGTPPSGHHGPIYEYATSGGNCAVTGGYVYRGSRIPNLVGAYVFADFCAGRLRAFTRDGDQAAGHRFLGPQVGQIASFGEDNSGELYVLSLGGGLHRIDPS